mgnify:CR=1 FL=1
MFTVLDVSRWQGRIDWDTVKASGRVHGVMLRALGSRSGTPYIDPMFEANYSACIRLGIPVGVYYYSCAVTAPQRDAELALLHDALGEEHDSIQGWYIHAFGKAADIGENAALMSVGWHRLEPIQFLLTLGSPHCAVNMLRFNNNQFSAGFCIQGLIVGILLLIKDFCDMLGDFDVLAECY